MRKTTKKAAGVKVKKAAKPAASAGSEVDLFMSTLEHPLKKEIEAVRAVMRSASPTIAEGVKWNAPSFRTADYFATVNLRSREAVQLVFHTGAKVKKDAKPPRIEDEAAAGLVKWLAKDRCLVTLGAGREFSANRGAFETLIREWIASL